MIGRFLCWLGFHNWLYGIDIEDGATDISIMMMRYCSRCYKLEQVPPHKVNDNMREVEL